MFQSIKTQSRLDLNYSVNTYHGEGRSLPSTSTKID